MFSSAISLCFRLVFIVHYRIVLTIFAIDSDEGQQFNTLVSI